MTRPRLLAQLHDGASSPLVLVIAPPGYGKTTLLTQWGEADARAVAWLTLDATDNDPSRLLAYAVLALREVIPLAPAIFPRSPEPGPGFTAFALPRLTRALAERTAPFVLVIDDVHVLGGLESLDLLSTIVRNLPVGCQLVLAGRDVPRLPLSRLLVDRSVLTIGMHQLAMTPSEGEELLHAAGLPVGAGEAAMLVERTEGWPAGLYLAALALRDQPHLGKALEEFAGNEGLVADYLRDEVLERLPREALSFSLGTAALDRLSGPLCDAVLHRRGTAVTLEAHSRANLFITPTDRNRIWFRRHQLWAEMLLAELRRRNRGEELTQHRRAARWFEQEGDIDSALDHARAAGDYRFAAATICKHLVPYLSTGRAGTVRRWVETLPGGAVADLPWFGAAAALAYFSNGDIERAMYWLAIAERGENEDEGPLPDGRASLRVAIAVTRAALGLRGVAQMGQDAAVGYETEPPGSPWKGFCALLQGAALHLRGDRAAAMSKLREAVMLTALEIPNVHAWSLAQLALCAMEEGDWEAVRDHAERARVEVERNGLQDYTSAALVYAVSAMSCVHWKQPAEARRDAMRATRLLALLSGLAPWMSVEGRVVLANVFVALGDSAQAREVLRTAQRDLRQLPDAPTLRQSFDEAHRAAMARAHVASGAPPLTAAEIRVAQFLPTHLSFREIAERLHISRNTVKTEVISVYRKLGVGNRNEAVESLRALAVIDDIVVEVP